MLLSDSPVNERLHELLQDSLAYARGQTARGPRFGAATLAAGGLPIYLFDDPKLDGLGDVATDGFCVLIRASAFQAAAQQEEANPGFLTGSLALPLAGAAQACALWLGEALEDPVGAALLALPEGSGDPVESLKSLRVRVFPSAELSALLISAGQAQAARLLGLAPDDGQIERRRSDLIEALNARTDDEGPGAAFDDFLREVGRRSGSIEFDSSAGFGSGGLVEAGCAVEGFKRATAAGLARGQASELEDHIASGETARSPRI